MTGGRARRAALIACLLAVLAAGPALAAFPGSDPNESPRINTPNDPKFDRCEADDETTPGTRECTSYFDGEQYRLFGFHPDTANLAPVFPFPSPGAQTKYQNCAQLDDQGKAVNTMLGDDPCAMIGGIRADTAWKYSAGRSDVTIAILDNGIEWQEPELRDKIRLNAGELPPPPHPNGDGRLNAADWAGTVAPDEGEDEADSVLDPSDLIAHYSNGDDADHNGYVDDIAGWDFFNDDNDPFDQSDCCESGHGTDRAKDAAGAGNNATDEIGVCPECSIIPLRTSDSIVHDTNLVAMGTVYAADNGAAVTECACGGLSNSVFGRRAFRYADSKGVAQMMVSSDINSANHNYPTNYNEAIYVAGSLPDTAPSETCRIPGIPAAGSIPGAGDFNKGCAAFKDFLVAGHVPFSQDLATQPATTSFFRNANLTQYGGKADIVLMGQTGSENTGQGAGAAGLLKSFGRDQFAGNVGGFPEDLSGNEIRQLLTMTAEDVLPENTGTIGAPDKAQPGWDPHFGYGRVNLAAAMARVQARKIPPEVQIESPDWFAPIDVAKVANDGVPVRARIASPHFAGDVSWKLEYACGQDATDGSFQTISSGEAASVDGEIGRLSKGLLSQLAATCDGSITGDAGLPAGTPAQPWPVDPYPSPDPLRHAFQIRLTAAQKDDPTNVGRYRKTLFAYGDDGTLAGWPKAIGPDENDGLLVTGSGGEAAPRLFDVNGDNKLDVFVPTTSGEMRVLDSGAKPVGSWNAGNPVRTQHYEVAGAHPAAPGIAALDGGPREALRTPAIGDITGDGEAEVVDTAGERVYAWHLDGSPVAGYPRRVNPSFSDACNNGAARCFHPADRNLTRKKHLKRGFVGSPALADLDDDGKLDVVAGALDQRLYAFKGDGADVAHFPVRLDSDDPAEGAEIVNSPAIADLDGDHKPEVVIATNEVTDASPPSDPQEFDPRKLFSIFIGSATGNSVTYALNGDGSAVTGWPVKTGVLAGDLLPLVLPGHDAAIGDVDPANAGLEVSLSAATGPARLVKANGDALREYQNTPGGDALVQDKSLELNLADYPSIGKLNDALGPSVVKGGLSLGGAANLLATNQNLLFNHTVQAWNPATGNYLPGFPRATDDFQLLSQPVIAKVGGAAGLRQALVGTGLYQLHAYGDGGLEPDGWPKFTGGWIFATPSVGDIDNDGKLDVVTFTREGWAFAWKTGVPACGGSNGEWWTFHHDEHGTAQYGYDARPPGAPGALTGERSGDSLKLSWTTPGDDLECGNPDRFRVLVSNDTIGGPADGTVVGGETGAGKQGESASRTVTLPRGTRSHGNTHVAVVYKDEAGNWGRPADLPVASSSSGGGGGAQGAGRCIPRRLAASGRRIGPARIGRSLRALERRYRVVRSTRRGTRFCVRGGGRFVVAARRDRIYLVATTAKGHRTRGTGPGRRLRRNRVRGARRVGRGFFVGRRAGGGRVIYRASRGRIRFLAVAARRQAAHPRSLKRSLRRLGFR